MIDFVDEDFKEAGKEKVNKAESFFTKNKKLIGAAGVGIGLAAIFGAAKKKSNKRAQIGAFEMGKWAGRAELAEELAEKAVTNGLKKE